MANQLTINHGFSKKEKYLQLIPQLHLLKDENAGIVANLANFSAALKETFQFFWVGFYEVHGDQLRLGPFQGLIACTTILKGKGVCGTAWEKGKTIMVDNVDEFPGHIACSSLSKSEIVVPIFKNNEVKWILDVDDEKLNSFDEVDKKYLEEIAKILGKLC